MKIIKQMLIVAVSGTALALAGCSQTEMLGVAAKNETAATAEKTQHHGSVMEISAATSDNSGKAETETRDNRGAQVIETRSQGSRYEDMLLPAGAMPANEAAKAGLVTEERFDLLYIGNKSTSIAFANEIHNTWLAIADPNKSNGQVDFDAWSPTTQKVYKVTCNEGPKYVTCTGGHNAVVYII